MRSYHVSPAPNRPVRVLFLATVLVVLAGFSAAALPEYARIDVRVDGRAATLPPGATAAMILERRLSALSPGDVLDRDGAVVARGRGGQPTILRAGVELAPAEEIRDGDVLMSRRGEDVVESEMTTRTPIPIEVVFEGAGPLMSLGNMGAVGVRDQLVGTASGNVYAETVIKAAEPMTIKRYAPTSTRRKLIAITFDDGPWPGQTDAVLDILKQEKVKATFFMVGKQVYRYPAVARRVAAEGHAVANHTEDHAILDRVGPAEVRRQIAEGQNAIQRVVGVRPNWFRPPGGQMSAKVGTECGRFGLNIAMWSVDPQDWRRPPVTTLLWRVIDNTAPGAVILLHDGGGDRTRTIEALGPMLRELKKRDYTFVTLDELDS